VRRKRKNEFPGEGQEKGSEGGKEGKVLSPRRPFLVRGGGTDESSMVIASPVALQGL